MPENMSINIEPIGTNKNWIHYLIDESQDLIVYSTNCEYDHWHKLWIENHKSTKNMKLISEKI